MITKFILFENADMWNDFFNKVESGVIQKDPPDKKNISKMEKYLPNGGNILSVSVGYGNHVEHFIKKGYQVTGTDIANLAIDSMQEKYPEHTWLVHDTEETFPFDDSSFDGVFARLSLHYFSNQSIDKILYNLSDILKPNGVIFMVKTVNVGEVQTGKKQFTSDQWISMVSKHFNIVESEIDTRIIYSFEKNPSDVLELIALKK